MPRRLRHRPVCAVSGAPAGPFCGETVWAPYIPGVSPETPCSVHREIEIDRRSGLMVCSRCRGERETVKEVVEWWPPGVADFLRRRGLAAETVPSHNPECPAITGGGSPQIVSPRDGLEYHMRPGLPREDQQIAFRASAASGSRSVFWFLDGALVWRGPPGETLFLAPEPGAHTATVKDEGGRSATIRFVVVGGGA